MFEKVNEILKFDNGLIEIQKRQVLILILILLGLKFLITLPLGSRVDKDDLRINVNTANIQELQKVPYIGEKTALKTIKLRENYGYIEDINQLENVRNFKKFKYYIKTK
jgi:competence protein ComEA